MYGLSTQKYQHSRYNAITTINQASPPPKLREDQSPDKMPVVVYNKIYRMKEHHKSRSVSKVNISSALKTVGNDVILFPSM